MNIRAVCNDITRVREEAVVFGLFEKEPLQGMLLQADRATNGLISSTVSSGDFKPKSGKVFLLYTAGAIAAKRILLVGLGKKEGCTPAGVRDAAATAARFVRDMGLTNMCLPEDFADGAGTGRVRLLCEGAWLGLYRFEEYKTKKNDNGTPGIKKTTICIKDKSVLPQVRREISRTNTVMRCVYTARDMVSHPGNGATPRFLAQAAGKLAKRHGMRCRIINEKNAAKIGMGSFSSVARGSDEPARFIVLEHRPAKKKKAATIVLVGKAITFDSGGISLKPPNSMEEMKTDMAGGAAVISAVAACAALHVPHTVIGLVPATENLPSGHALKPGDIVTALSGKTIEIISTDAEGRLVLADALAYAARYKPDAIIDLATLTGACIIALGNDAAAVMGTDEALTDRIRTSAETTGERVWPLPLWESYSELIKSDIADMKNSGGRPAGTITAGCFLKEFVPENVPWAHLDIAGTAWTKKNTPCTPKGATGWGVRLLTDMIEHWND